MKNSYLSWCCGGLLAGILSAAQASDPGPVKLSMDRDSGPATVSGEPAGKFAWRVMIDRKGETGPLQVRAELPASGPGTWPINDVVVRDPSGKALMVRRPGIEWENLLVKVAADADSFVVQAEEPEHVPVGTSERDRVIQDAGSGAQARIARWPQGRRAALSIRFDDSHPTHLSKAIPILRDYGFKGTFMVNPGPKEPGSRQNFSFETQHDAWTAVMQHGDMELANHTAHHRGAVGDADMEHEIGSAAAAIRSLTPGRSPLMALNLGGGTYLETTLPLRHYLQTHHLFDASGGSLGMDDSYGGRAEAFRRALASHLERGLWCRIHFHAIGDGSGSSEANFRAALDVAKQHEAQLWIAGMADIHKHQTERDTATLTLLEGDATRMVFRLDCGTEPRLYDQPLTLEITPAPGWEGSTIEVRDDSGAAVPVEAVQVGGKPGLRFEAPPRRITYTVRARS